MRTRILPRVVRESAGSSLQWGRVRENADTFPRRLPAPSGKGGFNGAAFVRTRIHAVLLRLVECACALQWGRVRENADTKRSFATVDTVSMLQWGRVRENADTLSVSFSSQSERRFNGAAFVRTRILGTVTAGLIRSRLQWGRVRENADTRFHTPRNPDRSRFNGAAFVRTRIPRSKHRPLRVKLWLQWGRVRENADTGEARQGEAWVLRLQWGRVRENADTSATSPSGVGAWTLQWGRVRENADTSPPKLRPVTTNRFNGAAFVRTRIHGSAAHQTSGGDGFNGAAFVRTRIRASLEEAAAAGEVASMGPRS